MRCEADRRCGRTDAVGQHGHSGADVRAGARRWTRASQDCRPTSLRREAPSEPRAARGAICSLPTRAPASGALPHLAWSKGESEGDCGLREAQGCSCGSAEPTDGGGPTTTQRSVLVSSMVHEHTGGQQSSCGRRASAHSGHGPQEAAAAVLEQEWCRAARALHMHAAGMARAALGQAVPIVSA